MYRGSGSIGSHGHKNLREENLFENSFGQQKVATFDNISGLTSQTIFFFLIKT